MVKEPGVQDPNAKIASDGAKQSIANVRHEKKVCTQNSSSFIVSLQGCKTSTHECCFAVYLIMGLFVFLMGPIFFRTLVYETECLDLEKAGCC